MGHTFVAEELRGAIGRGGQREARWKRMDGDNLGEEEGNTGDGMGKPDQMGGVVVVSFMHDRRFWGEGLRKLVSSL